MSEDVILSNGMSNSESYLQNFYGDTIPILGYQDEDQSDKPILFCCRMS